MDDCGTRQLCGGNHFFLLCARAGEIISYYCGRAAEVYRAVRLHFRPLSADPGLEPANTYLVTYNTA